MHNTPRNETTAGLNPIATGAAPIIDQSVPLRELARQSCQIHSSHTGHKYTQQLFRLWEIPCQIPVPKSRFRKMVVNKVTDAVNTSINFKVLSYYDNVGETDTQNSETTPYSAISITAVARCSNNAFPAG